MKKPLALFSRKKSISIKDKTPSHNHFFDSYDKADNACCNNKINSSDLTHQNCTVLFGTGAGKAYSAISMYHQSIEESRNHR